MLRVATLLLLCVARAAFAASWHEPVKAILDERFTVTTPMGSGTVPVQISADWSRPLPAIRRVVIVVHGVGRAAASYLRGAQAADEAAGPEGRATLLIVPQFLADIDAKTFHLPAAMLHWSPDDWASGQPAHGPVPLSAFDVLDALLQRAADKASLPDLVTLVVAGHSAGGQLAQRYAIVGRGEAALLARHIHVRYVIANPSSYLYFSDDRPEKVDVATCPRFDQWKYGLQGAPPYVGDTTDMEQRFAIRDVIYLLGTADVKPDQGDLDKSCGGAAEGPNRLARGTNYFAYLRSRHPAGFTQRLAPVPDVGHQGSRMFNSACGLAALFDRPGCQGL